MNRKACPGDISDEEWVFVVPCLTPMREVFNGLRYVIRCGTPWRIMPNDLPPRRWVVERSFGWMARFRRLTRDYERLPQTLVGLHFLAFVILMLPVFARTMASCL